MITFYKLNDEEKNSLKKDSPLETEIKFYETNKNIKIYKNQPENYTPKSPERLLYNIGDVVKFGNYRWIVIEASEEKALLLCKRCVKEISLFESILSSKWKTSNINKWLNDGFYYAFKNIEKEKIIKAQIDETENYFFILNKNELYTAVNNLDINLFRFLEDELWWLRNSENEKDLYIVNNDKVEIHTFGLRCGIRPTVYIKNQKYLF